MGQTREDEDKITKKYQKKLPKPSNNKIEDTSRNLHTTTNRDPKSNQEHDFRHQIKRHYQTPIAHWRKY